jgi:hypothetical protein
MKITKLPDREIVPAAGGVSQPWGKLRSAII